VHGETPHPGSRDFRQHNRGSPTSGGREDPDRPWSPPDPARARTARRRTARLQPATDAPFPRLRPPERCRAVDRAVSVAVAPRRTSGSRRASRPGRSTGRRFARIAARTSRRPAPMQIGVSSGAGSHPLVAGRAHPVDTGVEPARGSIHRGISPVGILGRANGGCGQRGIDCMGRTKR
jgi:hypothetical protein